MDGEDYKRLSEAVTASLDLDGGTAELPRLAYKSRTQFYRLFRALIEETPGEWTCSIFLPDMKAGTPSSCSKPRAA